MKEKKKNQKIISGSVKIAPEVFEEAKLLCDQRGIKISHFATEALKEKVQKEKRN